MPHPVGAAGTATWLGHATVLIVASTGTRIVVDPWLEDNPALPDGGVDLGHLDGIAVTHGHFDHMGSAATIAGSSGAPVICTPELAAYFTSVGVSEIVEMNKGGSVSVGDVRLTMVPADHSSGIAVAEGQPNVDGGNAVGFVVHLPDDQGPVYIAGDTGVFGDMRLIRDLYEPELGLFPIDGHYNMGPREAAYAVELLGLRRAVPIHYGTFPVLTGTPDQLREHLAASGSDCELVVLEPGQSVPLGRTSS